MDKEINWHLIIVSPLLLDFKLFATGRLKNTNGEIIAWNQEVLHLKILPILLKTPLNIHPGDLLRSLPVIHRYHLEAVSPLPVMTILSTPLRIRMVLGMTTRVVALGNFQIKLESFVEKVGYIIIGPLVKCLY